MKTDENRDDLEKTSNENDLDADSKFVIKENTNQINEDIDTYKFGWGTYSEITNGRFAMIGFLAIILIELFSRQSFLKWAGIL
tara:strand:+ start:297 stop:545 length:249 start_codon:yes stop_codon:yes gene_type:complete